MKEKRIQIIVLTLLFVITMLGFIVGKMNPHQNVQETLDQIHQLEVFTDKRSYTAKEVFPVHVSTTAEYTVTSTHGEISLSKAKNYKQKLSTSGDQIIYVKLNAEQDKTTLTLKNRWHTKTLQIALENGYYIVKEKK